MVAMGISLSVAHNDADPSGAKTGSVRSVGGARTDHTTHHPTTPATNTARFLRPSPDDLATHWIERTRGLPPALTVVSGYVAAWAVLAASITAIGLLLTKAVLSDGHGRWDESINRWLAEHRIAFWNHVTSVATFMANTLPVILALVLVAAALVLLHRWREALFLVGALGFELAVFLVANAVVDRPRPNVPRLDSTPSTSSFPSGHIAATLALWCGTALIVNGTVRNRIVRIVAWVVAVLVSLTVAFARTYRGMHHLTDVVAGALLGVGALAASAFAVRVVVAVGERRRAHHPSAAPDAPASEPVLEVQP
jgi:membrane-associated phospholipid phosphatase